MTILTETERRQDEINLREFDKIIAEPQSAPLGQVVSRADIRSTDGPFHTLPEYEIPYPDTVKTALGNLFNEYNTAFGPIVAGNRESVTDYQHVVRSDGSAINHFVQIDMVGLPADYLSKAAGMDERHVREVLRRRIFEIESSIAVYNLLSGAFSTDGVKDSLFGRGFRESLDTIRRMHNRPIALLAVTDTKYQNMRGAEFGRKQDEELSDEEVRETSGFDAFFGPEEFKRYLIENGGRCEPLLYVRSSDPKEKLKAPDANVYEPSLLEDPYLREIIKAQSLTFNIDDPEWPLGDPRRINDTKAYLSDMGMAHPVYSVEDIRTPEFQEFLRARGIASELIETGRIAVRLKPMQSSYGCYGHERGPVGNTSVSNTLNKNLAIRGPYVVQPEMTIPTIMNETDGSQFVYIDRNFMFTDGTTPTFLGGFRTLMPANSMEAKKGRVHGSRDSVYGEII